MKKNLYSAAFFDIDGTLYDHKTNKIPDLHMQALHELKKQGIKVCLCTARALPLIKNLGILHDFDWDGIVAGAGSYVYGKDLELIYENCIDPASAQMIFDLAKKIDASLFVAGNTAFTTDTSKRTQKVLDINHVVNLPVRTLQKGDHLSVMSFLVDDPEKERDHLEKIPGIRALFTRDSIDIIKEGLSKFHGIQILMNQFGFDEHDYIAFGDGVSDLEMLQNAKLAAAMEDGDPALLNKIHTRCPSAHEAGIYTFLKENGII